MLTSNINIPEVYSMGLMGAKKEFQTEILLFKGGATMSLSGRLKFAIIAGIAVIALS